METSWSKAFAELLKAGRRPHLVLRQRAAYENDYTLPLVLILAMLECQLSNLHRAGKVRLALNLEALRNHGG